MRRKPVLPRLEWPAQALLYYEKLAIHDAERSGNWRYYVREDGAFFSVGNRDLFISEQDQLGSDDPRYHWARPFPEEPQARLSPAQMGELRAVIEAARLQKLDDFYRTPRRVVIDHQSAERWTVAMGRDLRSVVVENGYEPEELTRLRAELERLVSAASAQ